MGLFILLTTYQAPHAGPAAHQLDQHFLGDAFLSLIVSGCRLDYQMLCYE